MNPVNNHTATNQPADPTFLVMSALTINIPDPIMLPATIIVASNADKLGLNSVFVSDIIFCIPS
jgi:hypothetical protein